MQNRVLSRIVLVAVLFALSQQLLSSDKPPVFFRTQSSDEWVSHSIHVQRTYKRVLVVDVSDKSPKRLRIPAVDLNSRTDVNGPAREYQVSGSFRTLQEAADAAQGGDLVAVMPGHYAGFMLEEKPSAGD